MNLKHKVFSFAAASIFALSLGSAAMAADTKGDVQQKIVANGEGTLTASLGTGSKMDDFPFSLDKGSASGVLVVDVTDGRGSYAGWNVSLSATDFQPGQDKVGDAQPIPATGYMVTTPGELKVENQGKTDGIQVDQHVVLSSQKRVLRAEVGRGTGTYHQTLNTTLAIPAAQPAGTYQSTVTVTVASGPGQ